MNVLSVCFTVLSTENCICPQATFLERWNWLYRTEMPTRSSRNWRRSSSECPFFFMCSNTIFVVRFFVCLFLRFVANNSAEFLSSDEIVYRPAWHSFVRLMVTWRARWIFSCGFRAFSFSSHVLPDFEEVGLSYFCPDGLQDSWSGIVWTLYTRRWGRLLSCILIFKCQLVHPISTKKSFVRLPCFWGVLIVIELVSNSYLVIKYFSALTVRFFFAETNLLRWFSRIKN